MTAVRRNGATALKRVRVRNPMRDYDRAPAPLRAWLADAALQWSARSAQRLFERALRQHKGDVAAALEELDRRQSALLARDQLAWGAAPDARPGAAAVGPVSPPARCPRA